jgi:hypothetical protein
MYIKPAEITNDKPIRVGTQFRMKSSIFWAITPCSIVKNTPTFRKNTPVSYSGSKSKPSKNHAARRAAPYPKDRALPHPLL